MKTKEFINKVEALGFMVHNGNCYLEVVDARGKNVVDVLKTKRWVYYCEHVAFESLHEVKQTELMEIVAEYGTTQVKDREEEKRYRLRFNVPLLGNSGEYLFMNDSKKQIYLGTGEWFGYRNIFTESEITEMDITGFEKIEVADGE